jgi:hypothetical protein
VPVPSPSPPLSASCQVAGEALDQSDLRDAIRESRIAVDSPRLRSIEQLLRPNCLFNCGARKAVRHSASLLPLLQGSIRDLQLQRGLTLREILALTPRSQMEWEGMSGQALMSRMMRSCPESHCRKDNAIRDSRIASSSQHEFSTCGAGVLGSDDGQQSTTAGAATVTTGRLGWRNWRRARRPRRYT